MTVMSAVLLLLVKVYIRYKCIFQLNFTYIKPNLILLIKLSRGTKLFNFYILFDIATFFTISSIFRNKNLPLSSSFSKTVLE